MDLTEPGHFEVDLVHHCGGTTSGQYVYTLQMVDIATGWSERIAILGRSYLVMQDAFERILQRLPFAVCELHPDNGGEFLNHHLLRYWSDAMPGLALSRSRPYQKNDHRSVEQKNSSSAHAYLGQQRLDTVADTEALDRFYDGMWVYSTPSSGHATQRQQALPTTNGIFKVRRRSTKLSETTTAPISARGDATVRTRQTLAPELDRMSANGQVRSRQDHRGPPRAKRDSRRGTSRCGSLQRWCSD